MDRKNYNYFDTLYLNSLMRHIALQIGDYKYSARNSDINGWLICDGRSLSKDEYPELFEVIGTNFGSEDEFSFNLPDFRSRIAGSIGDGENELSIRNIGDSIGSEAVALTTDELPAHLHNGTTDNDGLHFHNASSALDGQHTHSSSMTIDGSHQHGGTTSTIGSHSHTYNDAYFAENTGGGTSIYGTSAGTDTDNNFVYRTAGGGYSNTPSDINTSSSGTHNHIISSDGSHYHTVTINDSNTHSHEITVENDGQHTHTFATDYTGNGSAHNNMQPTLFGGNVMIFAKFLPFDNLQQLSIPPIHNSIHGC
jgi:microcystin-dependent protein